MGCQAPLQGIFLTQGSNPCFLHLLHWLVGFSLAINQSKSHKCRHVHLTVSTRFSNRKDNKLVVSAHTCCRW